MGVLTIDSGTPTLADVRGWDTGHLTGAAGQWRSTARSWEDTFTALTDRIGGPGGVDWEGVAADAARHRAYADRMTVIGVADRLHAAADIARDGAHQIAEARHAVLRVVRAAEDAGFTVRQDFSVAGPAGTSAHPAGAAAFATELRSAVGALVAADVGVAQRLTAATTGLGGAVFAASGPGIGGGDLPRSPAETPRPTIEAVDAANRRLLDHLEAQYRALPEGRVKSDRLADVAAIRAALGVPDAHLMFLNASEDPTRMIGAATAVGDPFTADHLSVTVPGVGATTRRSMPGMTREAAELRTAAHTIAGATGMETTVATIAYLGYQPPLTLDSGETVTDDVAEENAPGLTAFLGSLDNAAKPGHTTALFGHSYGSLMSGIALRGGAGGLVDNVVLYGSPGFEATSPAQLGLRDDQFFVMTAPDDVVANQVGRLAPAHGWGADPNTVIGDRYLFTHLDTRAGAVDLGGGNVLDLAAAHGHSDYARDATVRMTGFNLAAVLLDRADLAVRTEP